ncbi:hypothetical protein DPMN_152567 [Dreissena polymorpha]|uniref:Uncharacterized protein n=1 Tax=Dreissena polymorpha TaxID=45954 RepID=A0A9D4J820_DREPO|nr:hypothetical protein DPMN_152567 [Dreissena polymorpha]
MTISLLSTPEQGGEQKKNRTSNNSNCEFNYSVESMAGNENVDNVVLDKDTLMAISQTLQDNQKSLAVEMKRRVDSRNGLTSWKAKTKHFEMRTGCCVIVWWTLKIRKMPANNTADETACVYLAFLKAIKAIKLVRIRTLLF